jgi:hypothetical protein
LGTYHGGDACRPTTGKVKAEDLQFEAGLGLHGKTCVQTKIMLYVKKLGINLNLKYPSACEGINKLWCI